MSNGEETTRISGDILEGTHQDLYDYPWFRTLPFSPLGSLSARSPVLHQFPNITKDNNCDLNLQCTETPESAAATAIATASAASSLPSSSSIPDGALAMELGLLPQQQQPGLPVECDAALTLNKGGGDDNNNNNNNVRVPSSIKDKPKKMKKGGGLVTGGSPILGLEQLEQQYSKPREEAAKSLGVSVSKFKRSCREHNINCWPYRKKNNKVVNVSSAMQDQRLITFKAYCGDYIIRFELPSTSKKGDVEKEVAKKLKIKRGTFNLNYLDEENELVLITCDDDLLRLVGQTTIRIRITPMIKFTTLISEYN